MAVAEPFQAESGQVTAAVEKYLEVIYHLGNEGTPAIGARLAERLGVAPPTVTAMLKRLQRLGLVTVDDRKEAVLTETGQVMALSIARRHYISERFLVDLLGMEWHRAHAEAHRLEYALSPEVERRLSALLGNPTTCPHGSPIPGSGLPREPRGTPLAVQTQGAQVIIERITEQGEDDERLLEYFWNHGLRPGARLHVVDVAPYRGTLSVAVGGQEAVMSFETAAQVLVLPVDDGA
ncbi:MAG: metal-dependent transcriptional regulator [Chloroflexi bacterium]|nr:metal-dependent transcriptional regulator [Chloroflexota bacterium]